MAKSPFNKKDLSCQAFSAAVALVFEDVQLISVPSPISARETPFSVFATAFGVRIRELTSPSDAKGFFERSEEHPIAVNINKAAIA